jgi:hypothetical protein
MSRLFVLLALLAALVVIVAHSASLALLTFVEVRAGDRRPLAGLAERNARRVVPLAVCGGLAILAAALFPATRMPVASLVLSSAATAFNLGTFAVEAVSLSAQWRLLNEKSPESSC